MSPADIGAGMPAGERRNVWMEMSLEKGSMRYEVRDLERFDQDLEGVVRSGIGVFGMSAEMFRWYKESKGLDFEERIASLLNKMEEELSRDPGYRYRQGRTDGRTVSVKDEVFLRRVTSEVEGEILAALREYRASSEADSALAGKLHGLRNRVSGLDEKLELPADVAGYEAFLAGYLFGALEHKAGLEYIKATFINALHTEMYEGMIVEARMALGDKAPADVREMAAAVEELQASAPTGEAELLLETMRAIEQDLNTNKVTIGEVYEGILGVINGLWKLVDRTGEGTEPVVIAELLRILDLYADRYNWNAIEQFRQKAFEAMPAAMKAIQGAA
jgi:hypothetical protein